MFLFKRKIKVDRDKWYLVYGKVEDYCLGDPDELQPFIAQQQRNGKWISNDGRDLRVVERIDHEV